MARPKKHSNKLAVIGELAESIVKAIATAQEEYDQLIQDSETLKVIAPALKKLQTALNTGGSNDDFPTAPAGSSNEPHKPGDLCNTCKNNNDPVADCTHDAAAACAAFVPIPPEPKHPRRSKKAARSDEQNK